MKTKNLFFLSTVALMLAAGCSTDQQGGKTGSVLPMQSGATNSALPPEVMITPRAIPGNARVANDQPTGGYAPADVQAHLKVDVGQGTDEVQVIRDSTDPFVITKPYKIKNADPYAVRSYLEAAVGARSLRTSPAQATAVKFDDGTGVVLVSAEEYRFKDNASGRGIDSIVESLDRKGLRYAPDADTYIYFPRISRAANLRDMLIRVGSSELDPQFAVSPSTLIVDGELNALIVRAPRWSWTDMRAMLEKYDRPIPEMRLSYKIIEIYAENDDRIGLDFQSWKNNEGVDLFSAGTFTSRNWGTFFASGVQSNGLNSTSYWNFNPKWNTRYLDIMTSIGKAKVLACGELVARNRSTSSVQVNTGFFYDRTFYKAGAKTLAEATSEFTYTEPNPDTIQREAVTKIMPYGELVNFYRDAGSQAILMPIGYTMRMMGTQTGTNTFGDVTAYLTEDDTDTDAVAKYLTGYVKADGTRVVSTWYNTDGNTMYASPGIIHGWLQYPMIRDGFKFDLRVTPVVTAKAAKIRFELSSISLLGWNADGSPRVSNSSTATVFQAGFEAQDFVIGGLKKSESVRSTTGLPFVKDLPVIGRAFSTESESIKQSQIVLLATVRCSPPDESMTPEIYENLGKIIKNVNTGMTSRMGNMFFQEYGLDPDMQDRKDRLDAVGNMIDDEYEEMK